MLFSKKDLIKIVVPIIIEQLLAITVGIADSMMVANAGEAAVSGVSLVDTLNLLMIYVFAAFGAGGSVIASQFIGKKDYDSARKASKQLYFLTVFVAFVIMLVCVCFRTGILKLIFGELEADVMSSAQIYFLFTALSYPFLAVVGGCSAIFRAAGNTKLPMLCSIIINCINIVGNAILIFVFKMGAAGAAIATLFSRIVGTFILTYHIKKRSNLLYIDSFAGYKPDFPIIKSILRIGIPNGIENSMFQFGKVLTQSVIASFGTMSIAANAVGNSLSSFQYVPGTAIGMAMITIVGRCVGAEEKKQAKQYSLILLGGIYAFIIVIAAVMTICSDWLISLYNLSAESADIAKDLMFYHSIVISLIWPLAFPLTNAFRASGDVKYPLVISMFSMWVFRVGMSFVLGKYFNLGIYGVWYAMFIDWAFRALIYLIRFARGTWLAKYKAV